MDQTSSSTSSTPDLTSTPGESSVSSGEVGSDGFKRKPCRQFNRRNYDPIGKENIDPNFFMFEVQLTPDSSRSKGVKKGRKSRQHEPPHCHALAPRKINDLRYERLR